MFFRLKSEVLYQIVENKQCCPVPGKPDRDGQKGDLTATLPLPVELKSSLYVNLKGFQSPFIREVWLAAWQKFRHSSGVGRSQRRFARWLRWGIQVFPKGLADPRKRLRRAAGSEWNALPTACRLPPDAAPSLTKSRVLPGGGARGCDPPHLHTSAWRFFCVSFRFRFPCPATH